MASINQSFHNTIDQLVRPYQTLNAQNIWVSGQTILKRTESVAYQFYPFFHPYVGRDRAFVPNVKLSLIQRLRDGGVPELEESDTLYMPQPNPASAAQPLQVQPNSTRATLYASVTATRPGDSSSVPLTAGTPLTLPDSTSVTVAAGTAVYTPDGTPTTLPMPSR